MMALTHIAIATSCIAIGLDSTPLTLVMAAIGSQLPDIDTTDSYMGKLFYPVASWIQARYAHRTITHCLYFTFGVGAIAAVFYYLKLLPPHAALALPLGHLTSCLADCFTKQGVQLFYPRRAWVICGSNPNARLATGSTAEYWVLAIFIGLLTIALNFNEGNLKQSVSQVLGNNSGVEEILNSKGKDHLIYADILGTFTSDRTPADGNYLVIDQVGKEFLLKSDKGIFLTGQQINVTRISATPKERALVKISQLTFNDEAIAPKLYKLAGDLVYLTGELAIESAEDLKIGKSTTKYPTIERSGTGIKLSHAPLERVYKILLNSFGTGEISIRTLEILP